RAARPHRTHTRGSGFPIPNVTSAMMPPALRRSGEGASSETKKARGRCRGLSSLPVRSRSLQQESRLPADALGVGLELLQRPVLNLPHPLLRNAEQVADLAEAVGAVAGQAEAEVEHLPLARAEVLHQEPERLLALVVL